MGVHGCRLHPLGLKGDADLHGPGAAGEIAVVVALPHAHPAAGGVESRAGHQHEVELVGPQEGRPAQNGGADAICADLPAVGLRHGGGQRKAFAADGPCQYFALCCSLSGQRGEVGFAPECGVEQDVLRRPEAVQPSDAGAERRVGRNTAHVRQRPAGGDARFPLRRFLLRDGHGKNAPLCARRAELHKNRDGFL